MGGIEVEKPYRGGAKKPGSTGWDGFEEQSKYFAQVNKSKGKEEAPSDKNSKTYYIEHLPRVMELGSYTLGPRFMQFWLSNAYKEDDPSNCKNWRSRALDHDKMKNWKFTTKHDKKPDIIGRKNDIIARIKQHAALPEANGATIIPNPLVWSPPSLENAPNVNHTAWGEEVDKWGFWEESLSADGAGPWDMVKEGLNPYDDLMLAIGRFSWWWIPTGVIQKFASTYNFKVSGYALYAYDTYSFEGDQTLGYWNVDVSSFGGVHPLATNLYKDTDGTYKSGLSWCKVNNLDFQRYRRDTKKGLDFAIYSDLKQMSFNGEIDISFT